MSFKSEAFKAKQFDAIARLVGELYKKESYLKEYEVEMKPEEKSRCLEEIRLKIEEPQSSSDRSLLEVKDDRYS